MSELPGLIVVAEQSVYDALTGSGVPWNTQTRQESIAQMWDGLGGGYLDITSVGLVFSDSLLDGLPGSDVEFLSTAAAITTMAAAGAHVFVVVWDEGRMGTMQTAVAEAALTQGHDPAHIAYTFLPATLGARGMLDMMRGVLAPELGGWPAQYNPVVDVPLTRHAMHVNTEWGTTHGLTPPPQPQPQPVPVPPPAPVAPTPTPAPAPVPSAYPAPVAPTPFPPPAAAPVVPAPASAPQAPVLQPPAPAPAPAPVAAPLLAPQPTATVASTGGLLDRPPLPGQVTLAVTSSKGGAGKSSVAMLLAGMIAQSSAAAGRPLKVCLVDMDTRDGQVGSMIGKFMPTALNIRVQPVWDERTITSHLVHDDLLGIDTLLAPIRPRTADMVNADFYRVIIRSLQRTHDVVIMDTSVQYLDPLISEVCLPEATAILFVTTMVATAVQGMARALREITTPQEQSGMGIPREKIGIVVNQSVANVGMEKDQVLTAGLGVPVVGVIPLATTDVITATNLNRMSALLRHDLLGPAYFQLARTCLPNALLAPLTPTPAGHPAAQLSPPTAGAPMPPPGMPGVPTTDSKRRGLFRR